MKNRADAVGGTASGKRNLSSPKGDKRGAILHSNSLLHNDIDDATRHHDGLDDLLAIGVFRCALIGEDGLLSILLADAGRELDGEAGLATELHRHCNLRVLHLLLIVCRPLGIAYAAFVAEVVIEFLGDVRRKWSNEDDEAVEDFTRVTLLQFANGNHECRDAGVVRESLYVARNLLDELMEKLLLLGSRRIVHSPALS